jgi:predicted 3-demethylubiquinone-9 3-methyltransferase (glyoxalase superfamily)
MAPSDIVPCLWLDAHAEAAASLYLEAFADARVDAVARYPESGDNPAKRPPGSVLTVDVRLAGQAVTLLNGGPSFRPNPSLSFHVILGDEADVDALHAVLAEGGAELMPLDTYPWSSRYAWIEDRFGVSWQLMTRPDTPEPRIVPCLMFAGEHHGGAREAIDAYVGAIPGSRVLEIETFAEGEGGEVGTVKQGRFELAGRPMVAMDGGTGHAFGFDEGASLQVLCSDQAEVDRVWAALATGGQEGPCGWVRDRFGLWWQVVPESMAAWMSADDAAARDRVFYATLPMGKLDVEALEQAFRGE